MEVLDNEIDIIIHAKRTLVFNGGEPWKKKDNDSSFDVTMGSLDGAETCELVVCYILSILQQRYGKSMGRYRDDGLGISTRSTKQTEKAKQHISKVFNDNPVCGKCLAPPSPRAYAGDLKTKTNMAENKLAKHE